MENNKWKAYINGNCITKINLENGTKIHETINENDTEFIFDFAESCDFNITNKCDGGCPYCYQGCTMQSPHADLMNLKFLDTLHPYTELAINGNDLSHPQLIPFLEKMFNNNIIVNLTVNQKHFIKNFDYIEDLVRMNLIKGVGVSISYYDEELIAKIKTMSNVVLHLIAGVITRDLLDKLADKNLKILILGYKKINRGEDYYTKDNNHIIDKNIEWLKQNLDYYFDKFQVISFDNLGIKQLEIHKLIGEDAWNKYYMGDDGTQTFYIDGVNCKFAETSISPIQYNLLDNIDDMFKIIKNNKKCID